MRGKNREGRKRERREREEERGRKERGNRGEIEEEFGEDGKERKIKMEREVVFLKGLYR
jgi:hypothetical protein